MEKVTYKELRIFTFLHPLMWWLYKCYWTRSCYTDIQPWRYRHSQV